VRKFNFSLLKNTGLWLLSVVALCIIIPLESLYMLSDDVHAKRFCAYGQVYVEFKSGNKIWGTTFLNEKGKPVMCDEENEVPKEPTAILKGNVI